ncbi:MAG: ACT domain-containing protein [Clostridia bacterium]|nr:ACT domain-containing protein [Clostridia bacterium]
MRSVITVIGVDGVGIIASVSAYLSKHGINIIDITQTTSSNQFLMVMLVDFEKSDLTFHETAVGLAEIGKQIGQSITLRHEKVFNSMHRI